MSVTVPDEKDPSRAVEGEMVGGSGEADPTPPQRLERRRLWGAYLRLTMVAIWLPVAYLVSPEITFLWGSMVVYLAVSLLTMVLYWVGRAPWFGTHALPLFDVVLVSLPVYALGSQTSPAAVFYLAPIVAYVVTRGRQQGLLVLLLCIASYLAVIGLESNGVLPPGPFAHVGPDTPSFEGVPFVRSGLVMIVSMVVVYLFLSTTVARIERQGEVSRLLLESERAAQAQSEHLRERLEEAERLESLGRLAGGVAHDFNNLLTGILGYARIVRDELGPESPARPDIDEVLRAGERASELTGELLAFSRKQMVRPRPVDLNDLLVGLERMLARIIGEDVDIRFARAADLGVARADPSQLERVVLNLVVNARDAMETGGRLTIATANVTVGPDGLEGRPDHVPSGDFVVVRVIDTGPGMDGETLGRIFEPFFTTKEAGKGTGLGLASVYGIVKQHDGHMHVWSRPGHGTTFEVYLPASPDAAPEAEADREGAVGGQETVLVVEDEMLLRRLAMRILTHGGYRVLCASGGEQALEVLAAHEGALDLLLTDVIMPGMNGGDVADEIRRARPSVRVLFMSGYTDDVLGARGALPLDMSFIQKPFTAHQLLAMVRETLDADGEGRPSRHPSEG